MLWCNSFFNTSNSLTFSPICAKLILPYIVMIMTIMMIIIANDNNNDDDNDSKW